MAKSCNVSCQRGSFVLPSLWGYTNFNFEIKNALCCETRCVFFVIREYVDNNNSSQPTRSKLRLRYA